SNHIREQAPADSKTPSWASRRLRTCGPYKRWAWHRETSRINRDLSFWHERDPEENERTRLPDWARLEVPAVWVAELYKPSTIHNWLDGIKRLGWEFGSSRDESLAKWTNDVRQGRLAGWTNLGMVMPPDQPRIGTERTAVLPPTVQAAMPHLMSVTPSITAL